MIIVIHIYLIYANIAMKNYTPELPKMDHKLSVKLDKLKSHLLQYPSAIIAFSGGTDSTLLAFICKQVIGKNAFLITATSSVFPQSELNDAKKYATFLQMDLQLLPLDVFSIKEFAENPPERCYFCKRELLSKIKQVAMNKNISTIFEGSNTSDDDDFRPGKKAVKELGIISPLACAGINKSDIYELSRYFNLPTAIKPSMACLASRFPYGEVITPQKLQRVEKAEKELHTRGYNQFRIRSHGDLARLELTGTDMKRAFDERNELVNLLKKSGFKFCCLDLQGYRTGAMNESL